MMAGHRLGAIEIRRRLGKGGVGEVHLGYDTHLDRNVAVKALRPEFAHDPAFVKRFVGEAKHLARLNHPNIATLYSLHNDGQALCMVMEYIDGRTLDDLASTHRFGEAEVLAVAAQAMEGLAYAHGMGVVHRDIKPANLMINGAGTLKIMDFGIARLQGSERMTRQGAIVGSIAYMAPEQILGREGDERSDVYSLAVVLYELLCAVPPFSGDSEYALMKAQIDTDPPRLVDHLPEVRPEIESAILRALAKAPEQRFATVAEFRDALLPSGVNLANAARQLKGRFAAPPAWDEAPPIGSETRLPESPVRYEQREERADPPAAGKPAEKGPPLQAARQGLSDLWPRLALAGAALFSVATLGAIALDVGGPSKSAPAPGPEVPGTAPAATAPTAPAAPGRGDAEARNAPVPPAQAKQVKIEPSSPQDPRQDEPPTSATWSPPGPASHDSKEAVSSSTEDRTPAPGAKEAGVRATPEISDIQPKATAQALPPAALRVEAPPGAQKQLEGRVERPQADDPPPKSRASGWSFDD